MPKESFKKGKLILTYDMNDNKDKIKKMKYELKKGKKQLESFTKEELEQLVLNLYIDTE